jgi:hypothetical protein
MRKIPSIRNLLIALTLLATSMPSFAQVPVTAISGLLVTGPGTTMMVIITGCRAPG